MKNRNISCSFTGHRPSKLPWGESEQDPRCVALKQRIADAVRSAYEEGYRHFICGMAVGCDFYFCEAVLALRESYGDITLEAAVPCPTQSKNWSEKDRERYQKLLAACDFETMVQDHYAPGCMQRRNRYIVDHSSLLIAVYDGMPGGTRQTIEYAFRRGISVVDIQPESVSHDINLQETNG